MKILHTISSLGTNSGGPTTCSYNLVKGLISIGIEADILTNRVNDPKDRLISEEQFIKTIAPTRYPRFGYSGEMKEWLMEYNQYDLYHANALWQYSSHITAVCARKMKKPYLLSPHGMLYPEALQQSKWIKKVSLALYQRSDLKLATVLHATGIPEMEYIRSFGLKQPIAVIPNAINFTEVAKPKLYPQKGKRRIGFMGRLVPIKNLDRLIKAWGIAQEVTQDAELVIIGEGDPAYKMELLTLSRKSGIKNIIYKGFLIGTEQDLALRELSYLILPSKSENFGMVVSEALIRGIPVIASKGTPWEALNTQLCGWWVDNDVNTLAETIKTAILLPETDRLQMGERGIKLIKNSYSVDVVASNMARLYDWILNGGEKPEFIYL